MKPAMSSSPLIVTAGSSYLDIDAYACAIALAELLQRMGKRALPYSRAALNYSVCPSLIREKDVWRDLPLDFRETSPAYILVDVSDPAYICDSVPTERILAVFDHHVGFEEYWKERLGEEAHIEFIGAAATLIYEEWVAHGLLGQMSRDTAELLVAAILDNTLNLTSSNTTERDREAFRVLYSHAALSPEWRGGYFEEVQRGVEADLKNALRGDIKTLQDPRGLPARIAQLCVWDTHRILKRLPELREWLDGEGSWMLNLIDLQRNQSCFVCDDPAAQKRLETLFGVSFEEGVARTAAPYLRKQLIQKAYAMKNYGGNKQ